MACPGSPRAALCFLLPFALGCQYRLHLVEVGAPRPSEAVAGIVPGTSHRGDVLHALGAPDRIEYTLTEEVLEYRTTYDKGSDIELLVPTALVQLNAAIGLARGLLEFFLPSFTEPERIAETNFVVRGMSLLFGQLASAAPKSPTGEDALVVRGRALQEDVVRVTLDRRSLEVTSVRQRSAARPLQLDPTP